MKIELLDSKGIQFSLVRFFQLNNLKLLIYVTNEALDEQGRSTIYISSIDTNGVVSANAVLDTDWDAVKNIIKDIVNANKNGQPLPVVDLDYNILEGIQMNGSKALKLMANYVELLKANQPVFEKQKVSTPVNNEQPVGTFQDVVSNNVVSFEQNPGMSVFNQNPVFEQQTQTNFVPEQQFVNPQTKPTFVQAEQNNYAPIEPQHQPIEESPIPVQNEALNVNNSELNNYQELYNEQVAINEQLQAKIVEYENKLETLKSIINN